MKRLMPTVVTAVAGGIVLGFVAGAVAPAGFAAEESKVDTYRMLELFGPSIERGLGLAHLRVRARIGFIDDQHPSTGLERIGAFTHHRGTNRRSDFMQHLDHHDCIDARVFDRFRDRALMHLGALVQLCFGQTRARELALELGIARAAGRPHVGILGHHLVHDETAWSFLDALLEATSDHPAVVWTSAIALLDGPAGAPRSAGGA